MLEQNTRRALLFFLAFSFLLGFSRVASAQSVGAFSLTVTPSGGISSNYSLSWTAAVDVATTATVSYHVYAHFGFITSNPLVQANGWQTVAQGVVGTAVSVSTGAGTICFVAAASTTVSGVFALSNTQCHSFVHPSGASNTNSVTREDSAGTQLGVGQQWKWTYFLDKDSLMTLKIFPPNSVFYTDPVTGFSTTTAVSTVTVIENIPRSGEQSAATTSNTEIWDLRNSSGVVVANGLYYAYFMAVNPLQVPTTRYAEVFTLPVNTLRFTNFNTAGINSTTPNAVITYAITGNSTMRIVIAKPGRQFTVDGNGDVQALNEAGTAVDTSSTSVVRVISINVSGSASNQTQNWDGRDSNGVAVSSGLYAIGISAKDAFGNRALDMSGNNGPLRGTIAVDRSGAAVTISAISVDGTTSILTAGAQISGGFNRIIYTLNSSAGQNQIVGISVSQGGGPSQSIGSGGVVSISDKQVTYTTSTISSTGTYTVAITPVDTNGNIGALQSFSFTQTGTSSGGGSGAAANATVEKFRDSVKAYPNPATSAPARIDFRVNNAAAVDFDFYTLLGERVFHQSATFAAGDNTFIWNLVNDGANRVANGVYLVRITAHDGNNVFTAVRKIMVVR